MNNFSAKSATGDAVGDNNLMRNKKNIWKKDMKKNWVLYLIFVPAAIYFIVFNYLPMMGVLMSFQEVVISKPIFDNTWIGLENFRRLFSGNQFELVLRNTAIMALLNITIGFILPIILALLVSEVAHKKFKRTVQTTTYMPYFISTVIIVQLVKEFVGTDGAITALLSLFGMGKQNMLLIESPPAFWFINCFTDIWQGAGYASIMFVAAISNVDKDMHEAAVIDGANRFRRMVRITLPSILPTIVMMFTIKAGTIFTTGFDKVLLLYTNANLPVADCLATYTYRMSLGGGGAYGLSAAAGLFQSLIATGLLIISNSLSRALAKTSLI